MLAPGSASLALGTLQALQVAILGLHDWVPLGRLNDVVAVRRLHGVKRLLVGTLISTAPFVAGLAASLPYLKSPFPPWLRTYLLIAYALLFLGEIESWWAGYFFGYKSERAPSYREMFGRTHAFLPLRHGMVPNTLHVILHSATLATLVVLVLGP